MKKGYDSILFLAGVLTGLGAGWAISTGRQLDNLTVWEGALAHRYGAGKAKLLITAVRRQRNLLNMITYMPENPTLKKHLVSHILPGLALYRVVLQEQAGDKPTALAVVDEAFSAQMAARARVMTAPLRVHPQPFMLFKSILPVIMKQYHPDGWDFEYEEISDSRVAFSATRCYYLDTLTELKAPELCASFCRMDDVLADSFPEGIRFIRPHTLGRGDRLCDFEYCRMKNA